MTMTTTERVRRRLAGVPLPVLCAVSGGLDSMCLLHLLQAEGIPVTAAHFNHRLRETADRDEKFVRGWCADHGIPCVCGDGDVRTYAEETGKTIEEAGRELRYAFLEKTRQETGCAAILTAHHADDNAETMLLNLLRGTGLQGLTGIRAERDHILRPLLEVTRVELEQYAEEQAVPHMEDETNETDDAARNVLRHRVLPVLRELNPRAVENMNRTAELLREDGRALEQAVGTLLNRAHVTPGVSAELPLAACEKQPRAILGRAVLSLLVSVGGHRKDLTARHVDSVLELRQGREEGMVSLPYGLTARRRQDTIVIEKTAPPPREISISPGEIVGFGLWSVTLSESPGGLPLRAEPYAVTLWRGEDRMTLPGSRGKRSLKRLCAERGISPSERDALPVLRAGETPAAVPGVGVDLDFTPRNQDAVLYVSFTNHKKHKEKHYEK